jgi:DNA-nicking Smr family endonuclease
MGNVFTSSNNDGIKTSSSSSESSLSQSDVLTKAESLREKANQLQSNAKQASKQSQWEYRFGSKSEAKILSNEKKALYKQMNERRRQAAALIFGHYNGDRPADVIDLHGLYVAEALEYLQRKIDDCRAKNILQLKAITGMGNHSPDKIAKIKPKVEEFALQNHLNMTSFDGYVILKLSENRQYQMPISQNNTECIIL